MLTASLVFEVELRGAYGWGSLVDDDGSIAELTTGGADLVFTMGGFVTRHLRMGYEATAGRRRVLESRPGELETAYYPSQFEADGSYFLPFGGYLAIYPLGDGGLSLGGDLGLGFLLTALPYMGNGFLFPALADGAGVFVGYDHVGSDHLAWGARARYGQLGFSNSDYDGHERDLESTELTLAVHISAF